MRDNHGSGDQRERESQFYKRSIRKLSRDRRARHEERARARQALSARNDGSGNGSRR